MLKILLVEDSDIDARLTQDILAEWSIEQFDVVHVARLGEAFSHLARSRFDAVLLDLSLPDGHGLSTLRQMQAANPTIPIIILSGFQRSSACSAGRPKRRPRLSRQGTGPAGTADPLDPLRDRTQTRRERLTYLAQYDQLTGLVNRTLFRDRLIHAMARSKRLQQPMGLMLLDLDRSSL